MQSIALTPPIPFSWNFAHGASGWQGGFADYHPGDDAIYEFDFGVRSLPSDLGENSALFIQGHNRSDDLFMYFRNQVTGLSPNTNYHVTFDLQLASDAPDGSFGIGGSPANSVFLKAGATLSEPIATHDPTQDLMLLNIDKGYQAQPGKDSVVLGDIAKPDDGTWDYALISRNNFSQPFSFQTDDRGSAWIFFGTDSGFEGLTRLYYTQLSATFSQAPDRVEVPEPGMIFPLLLLGAMALFLKNRTRPI